ncbi:MAG: hypothetical protein QOF35_1015 [Actinomycetota bacterium]|jgi:hypothetical protein|nr:hypothetical protein [Actinomycetota bacterium]
MKNLIRPRHLLDPWRDNFVIELRMRNVSGSRIGDALAQVDAHCTDSGQEPEEEFGDPVAYATHVAQEIRPADLDPRASALRAGMLGVGGIFGVLALLSGVAGLAKGGPAILSFGMLVGAAIGVVGLVVLFRFATQLQRPRRRGLLVGAIWLLVGAMSAPPSIWRSTAAELDAWLSVGVAVVLLGATWMSPWVTQPDRVVEPLTGQDSMPVPRWHVHLMRWLLPVTLVGVVILLLLMPH